MSTYAQFFQLGPFFSGGTLQASAKLYHYAAGTSTLKDIYEDRDMATPLDQPFVSDANGVFNFFGDGIYKLIVCGPDSVGPASDVLYTLDNFQILDPQSEITWGEGVAVASASTIALGPEIWTHISGSTNISTITGTNPWAWVVFDGNLTLNYSANLLTPASINLAVRAGDVVLLLNEGSGVWRVAAHYQADGLLIATQDSRTNTSDVPLTVRSTTSGTPAAGMGTDILLQAESADETPSDVVQIGGTFSDVGSGTEDSYFRVLLRVAGAALTECWRWAATGAFKGIFTHANSADRTYTLPDETTTLLGHNATQTVTNKSIDGGSNTITNIAAGSLKTSTGSSTGSLAGTTGLSITMNDYSFAPSVTSATGGASIFDIKAMGNTADPSNTIGRLLIDNESGGSVSYAVRWRYVTASDEPTIWVVPDADGNILSVWASDDPARYHEDIYEEDEETGLIVKRKRWRVLDEPPIVIRGSAFTARHIPLAMLENMALPQKALDSADRHIEVNKLKPANRLYRALQMHTKDDAPSTWLMNECVWKGNEFRRMTAQEKAVALAMLVAQARRA